MTLKVPPQGLSRPEEEQPVLLSWRWKPRWW